MVQIGSHRIIRNIRVIVATLLILAVFTYSNIFARSQRDQILAFARPFEFDYVSWTLNAFLEKIQPTASAAAMLNQDQQHAWVETYLLTVGELLETENQISQIFADPAQQDPTNAARILLEHRAQLEERVETLSPLVESILQGQVAQIISNMGLAMGGQPLPPVLYHISALPMALIISPRDIIREEGNYSLQPDLPLDDITALESNVESSVDVSALVVPVGGIATYPTMVMQTTDLNWMLNTICHEWVHNYLTLHPLGLNYDKTPELRTMNETTASIAGNELGEAVLAAYYPERVMPATEPATTTEEDAPSAEPPAFDFRAEMHRTRVLVDYLLAHGMIEQAERTMNARREVFLQNGYLIRRLNQAYFAFYGAYAESPGGAAGEDPVGPAVRAFRAQSATLKDFLEGISEMSSFAQLQSALGNP